MAALPHTAYTSPDFQPPGGALKESHPKATRRLLVMGLDKDCTEDMLVETFRKFGLIGVGFLTRTAY